MLSAAVNLHGQVTGALERALDGWFLGLLARLVFLAVLFVYFFNSALTKVDLQEAGLIGFFTIKDNAYFQIIPAVVERFGYDASQVPFIPYGLIVTLGTYSEFLLPLLIVLGFLTRLAALGMTVFIAVQSYVDIAFHNADAATIGAWFDNLSNAVILDQRAFWVFLLLYLVVRGPGAISLDYVLRRWVSAGERAVALRVKA